MNHVTFTARRRRRAGTLAASALAALACTFAASALAAGPQSGTYTGHVVALRIPYVVKLSLHGTHISRATINFIPFYCPASGNGTPVRFSAGTMTKSGSFTLHAVVRIQGQVHDRLTLSGRFTSHGTVSGTERTVVVGLPSCSGRSRFSAKR